MDIDIVAGVWSLALVPAVIGAVIGWDRWREPRRDPRSPIAVVDRRTLGDALRRVGRMDLDDPADAIWAAGHLTAARLWLRVEVRLVRSRRRRVEYAAVLERVELRLEQLGAPRGLYT